MRPSDIERLLEQVEQDADGSYRLVASKALAGTPVGRIRFIGTRPDDPNDLVPHEHRRELRAYGVFAAWLNHVDAKAINSLDTLVTVGNRSIVRHHLIDFGSALGSGGVAPADYWGGEEYVVEPGQVATQMVSLGFQVPKWRTRRYYEAPAVGRLPERNSDFNPDTWRPRVPNPAFLHATADDRFWAARRLAAMRTDLIRAAVSAGQFDDPRSEDFLVRALMERRDAIVGAYLGAVNPIGDVKLRDDGQVTFSNAATEADAAAPSTAYRAVWSHFDNASRTAREIGTTSGRATSMMAPGRLPDEDGAYLKIALTAGTIERPSWKIPVEAYFRHVDGGWRLIGLERASQ